MQADPSVSLLVSFTLWYCSVKTDIFSQSAALFYIMKFSSFLFVLSAFFAHEETAVSGFSSTLALSTRHHASSYTTAFLTPEQAADLVQASDKVYQKQNEDDVDDDNENLPIAVLPPVKAQRSFVSRVFSLPSSLWHPSNEELNHEEHDNADDVVYFPIVGFTFARDEGNKCRALPTVSNPSCRLRNDHEDLVGWFRPIPSEQKTISK